VQDVLNLVRFALTPKTTSRSPKSSRVLSAPTSKAAIFPGSTTTTSLTSPIDRKGSLWDQLRAAKSKRLAPVRTFLEDVFARRHLPPFEFITRAMERGRGLPRPGWDLILSRFGGPAREPVSALIDRASGFDADQPPSLELFLDAVERNRRRSETRTLRPAGRSARHDRPRRQGPSGAHRHPARHHSRAEARHVDGVFFTEEGLPVWVGPKGKTRPATSALRLDSNERALREHRRLLYVALTRAQDRLIVCGAWHGRSKEGRDKDSWYQLCDAGMQRLIAAGSAAQIEDHARWRRSHPSSASAIQRPPSAGPPRSPRLNRHCPPGSRPRPSKLRARCCPPRASPLLANRP
jgi:ATP-dependent helicase/nuclease subunit A